jgi:hypothetical protein
MTEPIIQDTVSQTVCALVCVMAMGIWAISFQKAMTLWSEKAKRYLLMVAILVGMLAAFCLLFFCVAYQQLDGVERAKEQESDEPVVDNDEDDNLLKNSLGMSAIFYGIYHGFLLFIKLVRLNFTRLLGNKKTTTALSILNTAYYLAVVAYSTTLATLSWHPTLGTFSDNVTGSNLLSTLTGIFGAIEVIFGILVELATVFYFRSVIFHGNTGYRLKDLGSNEYAAVFTAVWAFVATVVGPLAQVEFFFFASNSVAAMFLFQSCICLSLVCSVETVKKQYASGNSAASVSARVSQHESSRMSIKH